jgi:hypothetical protein
VLSDILDGLKINLHHHGIDHNPNEDGNREVLAPM